jgi:hypothetical protein
MIGWIIYKVFDFKALKSSVASASKFVGKFIGVTILQLFESSAVKKLSFKIYPARLSTQPGKLRL